MMAVGPDNFRKMLDGAHALDEHFRTAPLPENLPAVLGLIGYWHRAICDYPSRAVIPYDQRLSRLPAYLQQLDMESNGKGVGLDGKPVTGAYWSAGLWRTRHQWPARVLPAAPSGHRLHSRRVHCRRSRL
jgi:glucose-6-phosphate isomerase